MTATDEITVTLSEGLSGLSVDTPFQVSDISATGYSGQFVVSDVLATDSTGTTQFKYQVSNPPSDALPTVTGSTVNLQIDTVTSGSPYVFNISLVLSSACGMHADGVRQMDSSPWLLLSLQVLDFKKDKNAFVKYDTTSGEYKDGSFAGNENINSDSRAIFKPSYRNFHIKASNNSVIQIVSCFAIGYAEHFVTDTGGDLSITNSNSSALALKFCCIQWIQKDAFRKDDIMDISHIIPLETSRDYLILPLNLMHWMLKKL